RSLLNTRQNAQATTGPPTPRTKTKPRTSATLKNIQKRRQNPHSNIHQQTPCNHPVTIASNHPPNPSNKTPLPALTPIHQLFSPMKETLDDKKKGETPTGPTGPPTRHRHLAPPDPAKLNTLSRPAAPIFDNPNSILTRSISEAALKL